MSLASDSLGHWDKKWPANARRQLIDRPGRFVGVAPVESATKRLLDTNLWLAILMSGKLALSNLCAVILFEPTRQLQFNLRYPFSPLCDTQLTSLRISHLKSTRFLSN